MLMLTVFSLMPSCIYEAIDPDSGSCSSPGNYALSLTLDLPVTGNTRSGNDEQYEDYVDPSNIRLLFFKAQDDQNPAFDVDPAADEITLIREFKSSELSFIPIDLTNSYSKKWQVRIPVEPVKDASFITAIRDYDFKIAVLANWPVGGQALLNPDDPINKLHHLETDNYSSDTNRKETYRFLFDENKYGMQMGLTTDWVRSRKEDIKTDAAAWIRTHWDPTIEEQNKDGKFQYGSYSDLWFLWNFGGAASDNAMKYESQGDWGATWSNAWEKRNGANLRSWITRHISDGTEEGDVDNLNKVTADEDPTNKGDINYLQFKTIENAKAVKRSAGDGTFYYGVRLPFTKPQEGNTVIKEEDPGVFSFMARATGNLTIWARPVDNTKDVQLIVQHGSSASTETFKFSHETEGVQAVTKKISITGAEERLFIYNSTKDNPIEIYQIEYIQDKYLYDTDREGVIPTERQPIPMYGIQKFGALKDVWREGTVFDLSNFNNQTPSSYQYSDIYLLRSVAKVELLIPKSYKPHHVYLRSQNRTARCEPVDVITNTKDIWFDGAGGSTHPDACEWSQLIGRQPFYDTDGTQSSYQNALAWYYGRWDHVNSNLAPDPDPKRAYPHILNPMINRSDFTEFIKAESNDLQYERYVLYVPDKFVDDPNVVGDPTSDPKVCHIEFRGEEDSFTNLDDDNCYRIYFTKGGMTEKVKEIHFDEKDDDGRVLNWENVYEQNVDNLKKHWPIMRNHRYVFTVLDANSKYLNVKVQILAWKKQEFTVTW